MTATCCMTTQSGSPCSRRVEAEGMVCKQHMVMLTKQWKAEREVCEAGTEFDGGDNDWVDDDVRELFDTSPSPPPEYSQVVKEKNTLAGQKRAEKDRLSALVAASIEKGVYADVTCKQADHSGRWLWTVPPSKR